MRKLLREDPTRKNVDEYGMGVTHLWSQRESLVEIKELLHSKYERVDGTIEYRQVVVPSSLRVKFLYWVHTDTGSGHMGINKI